MRIAINGYFLLEHATGSGQHLYYLLEGLDALEEPNQYRVLYPKIPGAGLVRAPHLGPQFEIQAVKQPGPRLGARLSKLWWEQVALRRACDRGKVDLLHSPYFASPLFPNVPTVVTVHDVIPLVLPRYGNSARVKLYTSLVSAAARHADHIITVSETSKRDIVRALGVPASRIQVIHNAVDQTLHPMDDDDALQAVKETHGITSDFLLYFGGFDVRKNVDRVIRAFHAALPSLHAPHQLVLAGALSHLGHPLYPDPRPLIQGLDLGNRIIVTGRIPEEDKPLLYSAATAFIFPSLYEGFGIPVLEAMACGTPVITSDASSLPEVAGDAALLVNPTSIDALAEAVVRLLNDSSLREELRGRGLQRVSRFSWENSARKTLDIYRKVLQ